MDDGDDSDATGSDVSQVKLLPPAAQNAKLPIVCCAALQTSERSTTTYIVSISVFLCHCCCCCCCMPPSSRQNHEPTAHVPAARNVNQFCPAFLAPTPKNQTNPGTPRSLAVSSDDSDSSEFHEDEEADDRRRASERGGSKFNESMVPEEYRELFKHVGQYEPKQIELEAVFKPFMPDYIAAIGWVDPFMKASKCMLAWAQNYN